MSDLLFDVPWWLFIVLILVGAVVFWSGNNRGQRGLKTVGIGLILLAGVLKTVSFFVVTDKEKVTRQTLLLVHSVQTRDWTTFQSLLDPDVSLSTSEGTIFPNSRTLIAGARHDCEEYNLSNVSATVTHVEQDAAGITVDINASSEQSATMGFAVPSSWKLVWDQTGKDWRLHEATCLRIGNETPSSMARLIGK